MSLYNIVGSSSLVAGQPEDISQVLANFQAIQTVLNGGIDNTNINAAAGIVASKLAGYPADGTKVLRGDGSWVGPMLNKVTASTFAGGPPVGPSDGDIWIATAVDANGTVWHFRYNAGSGSAYKWEFIGGPPMMFPSVDPNALMSAQTSTGVVNGFGHTVYVVSSTALTLSRGGDYVADAAWLFNPSAIIDADVMLASWVSGVWTVTGTSTNEEHLSAGGYQGVTIAHAKAAGVAAGSIFYPGMAASTPGSCTVRWNMGGVVPIRVS